MTIDKEASCDSVHGYFCGVDLWIEWSRNFQPYGLEAAEYFEKETSLS
jgi:hypothetical protein